MSRVPWSLKRWNTRRSSPLDQSQSIQGACPGVDSSLAGAVDDENPKVGFDADLAGQPGIRFEVRFTGQAFLFNLGPIGGGSPAKIWTRQVVHRAFPPQRCRISMPASSIARTNFFPVSTSKRLFTLDCHGGHARVTPEFWTVLWAMGFVFGSIVIA